MKSVQHPPVFWFLLSCVWDMNYCWRNQIKAQTGVSYISDLQTQLGSKIALQFYEFLFSPSPDACDGWFVPLAYKNFFLHLTSAITFFTLKFPPLLVPKSPSLTFSWVSPISSSILSWTLAQAFLLTHTSHIGIPQPMYLFSSSTFTLKDIAKPLVSTIIIIL